MSQQLNQPLDVFGQQPGLNGLYTNICLVYPLPYTHSQSTVITVLKSGLQRLSDSFPWIAGKVVNEGSSDGNTGVYKIVNHEATPRLVFKDLRQDPAAPSMDLLREKGFAMSDLDESVISPRNTLPDPSAPDAPVFLVQATFIERGLVLTFAGQHSVMDITGQAEIMRLLSKACGNVQFTLQELEAGDLSHRDVIPLLDDNWQSESELDHQTIKPASSDAPQPPPPPKCSWASFTFSSGDLVALKAHAANSMSSGFVSTDDAITALIWQATLRARLPRLDVNRTVTLGRAIDPRRFLGLPLDYSGLVQNMAYSSHTARELAEEPLGTVASRLREAIVADKLAYSTRALATTLARSSNKAIINVTATLDLSADLMISSWSKVDACSFDFNLGLGKPEAVRRPRFFPVESLIYLLPKEKDGGIATAICLRDEDLERLQKDEVFARFAKYVG